MHYEARSGVTRSGVTRSGVFRYPLTLTIAGVDRSCDVQETVGLTITKSLSGGLSQLVAAFRVNVPAEGNEIVLRLGGDPRWGGTVLERTVTLIDETIVYW
jgi:hypothetical protein